MVLKCIWTIELNWMEKYGKMEAKHKFWKKKIQGTVSVQEMLCFPISTSFRILTITCSFPIRFELFKFLVKIYFNENQPYRNRNRQILIISGLNIHSKWGYVQVNSWFSF